MSQLQINALFQDGKLRPYTLPTDSKVGDLISLIESDTEVKIPKDRIVNVLYLGRFLDPSALFNTIEHSLQFTVNIFFRREKNFANNTETNSSIESQNPSGSQNDTNNQNTNQNSSTDLHGFDRLARMGLPPNQIQEVRQRFHLVMSTFNLSESERIEIEEEWFPALFNNIESTNGNFLSSFFASQLALLQSSQIGNYHSTRNQRSSNRSNHQNNGNLEEDTILDNLDLVSSQDRETSVNRSQDIENSQSWLPFCIGTLFGFIFGINWYIFIPMMHPNRSVLIGYLFGCGLYYMVKQMVR
ncbi:hypothetical protein TRFO_08828 [Tritrichomonas foetus]|uniref:DSC E3 ubiquitin ligase complex subunit 3 C-terminal domain-containing protein n=1 Tax=Tritrichomonas foetus TaxID=1144522 RepID=A0A1J4JJM9_9EUKA|nr:hypothetical protein TRFO_08828 [Tritrichomonas foetus]|eukprot:OHS98551.1 hypothetical protein TRFO_08828 [Tritrichomonas foetus]